MLGSASWPDYDGGLIAAFGDVVVVSMNYRLGRLGFLDAKSRSAPGNQGLLDQNLALRWIHDNIESFGGDRTQVRCFLRQRLLRRRLLLASIPSCLLPNELQALL